ncbi:MAG: TonB-dependent receptor family protein [Gammaproteobacteria bacterium]
MKTIKQNKLILGFLMLLSALSLSSEIYANSQEIESVTIIGKKADVKELPGSGQIVSNEELLKAMDTDIHKILSAVPGVYFRTEDGYGLRPNISIRGTSIDRSAKITLMEDGILVAPAPYTSSSAYYFPTTGRINSVEVLKGPSSISQGPSTIGGAINMISTPIPETNSGKFTQEFGQNGMLRTHAYYGGVSGNLGGLVEIHEHKSDGFDSIANVGGDTGFNKSDILIKARYETGDHSLTLKILEVDEVSDQSYVGLSGASFNANPRLRYGMTQYDEMNNDGDQTSLTYMGDFENIRVIASTWSNDYHRDWFKVDKANNNSDHGVGSGINNVIAAANAGNANAQAILDGELAVQVKLKHNNRFYTNEGYQFKVITDINNHSLTFGYRDMEDSESRYQNYECFDQGSNGINSALYDCSTGYTGSNNRLRVSEATSYYIEDKITLGNLILTIGHRSEEYDQVENRWNDGVPTRTQLASGYPKTKDGDHSTTGFGATYDVNENLQLVAGFHEGMTAMFGTDPEKADNMELGLRYSKGNTSLETFYFESDYKNLKAVCKNSQGGDCDDGDVFDGGAVDVSGLELSASHIFEGSDGTIYPVALTYTSTDATFANSFDDDGDYWGVVAAGDDVPYVPSSSLALVVGFVGSSGLSGNVRLVDNGSSCSTAACGINQNIEAHSFIDLNLRKPLNDKAYAYLIMENLLDHEDIVARAPKDGARSQKPRTLKIGFTYKL